jgi:hypothetical protein
MPGEVFDIRAHDTTPAAPGDLELLQRFLNLHEHTSGTDDDLPPSRELVEAFLRDRGLLGRKDAFTDHDRDRALELIGALHGKVRATRAGPFDERDAALIDGLAGRAGLRPRFAGERPTLAPTATGVAGAFGRLIAIAFLADLDGSWAHLKECAGEDCDAVFFDRSKNRSGRWCSMSACGNRAKVRAWRERQRADADA